MVIYLYKVGDFQDSRDYVDFLQSKLQGINIKIVKYPSIMTSILSLQYSKNTKWNINNKSFKIVFVFAQHLQPI